MNEMTFTIINIYSISKAYLQDVLVILKLLLENYKHFLKTVTSSKIHSGQIIDYTTT